MSTRSRGVRDRLLVVALFLALAASPAPAQIEPPPPVEVDPGVAPLPDTDPTAITGGNTGASAPNRITPLLAPIPFKNSQLGWGLAVMVGAIHRFDPDTTLKPSTGAIAGFYTENDSWGVMAVEMARLRKDQLRLRGMASHSEFRYDFFGIGEDAGNSGQAVPLEQVMDFAAGSALVRVAPGIYVGPTVLWMQSTIALRGTLPPEIASIDTDAARGLLLAPGVQGEFDTRDDDYWPGHGSLASLKAWFFVDALGASREFQRYTAAWSWYTRLRGDPLILATNVNAGWATGDAPFYMLPTIGTGQYGLRGYTQGRYRDRVMTTAQAELRAHTEGRLGATAFFGFGQVAPDWGDLGDAALLPAGGLGLRYQLTRNFPMHMRLDYAWGRNGNLLYFSVSEAF